ncbi:MAG: hypothetical protein LKE51_01475 [Selenomonas sp.]|jgi:hypothetical protein|nr:hypothetical protein [Selenomonas sp.]
MNLLPHMESAGFLKPEVIHILINNPVEKSVIMGINADNMWMNLVEYGREAVSTGDQLCCEIKFQEMGKNA